MKQNIQVETYRNNPHLRHVIPIYVEGQLIQKTLCGRKIINFLEVFENYSYIHTDGTVHARPCPRCLPQGNEQFQKDFELVNSKAAWERVNKMTFTGIKVALVAALCGKNIEEAIQIGETYP